MKVFVSWRDEHDSRSSIGAAFPRIDAHPRSGNSYAPSDLRSGHDHKSASAGSSRHIRDRSERSRSEEHTSELQSRVDLVCRLLLEKKKIAGLVKLSV